MPCGASQSSTFKNMLRGAFERARVFVLAWSNALYVRAGAWAARGWADVLHGLMACTLQAAKP